MTDTKLTWLPDLLRFGGAVTGIVLTAIGGVMLINAVMKLYVFQFQTEPYQIVSTEECKYDHNRQIPQETGITKAYIRTAEEIAVCKAERLKENKVRFERTKKENMVDGLAMLLIGIPFWIIFWRKRDKK